MKKNSFIYQTLIVLSSLIFILGLSSCEKDNPQGKEAALDDLLENVDYRITEESYYTVEEMADLIYGSEGANPDDADLRRQFLESCEQQIAETNNNLPPTGFITYRYEYRTYRSDGRLKPKQRFTTAKRTRSYHMSIRKGLSSCSAICVMRRRLFGTGTLHAVCNLWPSHGKASS